MVKILNLESTSLTDVIDKKEKLLLEWLISDKPSMAKVMRIIQPEYFSPPLDNVVKFIKDYFLKYHGCPSVDLIEAETDIVLQERHMDSSEREYYLTEIEEHLQQQALSIKILEASEYVHSDEKSKIRDLIQEAFLVKIDRSIGTDMFESPRDRIIGMSKFVDERTTGVEPFDAIFGKVRRGELYLIYGVSSAGKSVGLGNIAWKMGEQGLKVCVISLELGDLLYAKRLDSIITGVDIDSHLENIDEIEKGLEKYKEKGGHIILKRMRNRPSVEDIKAYLQEYHLEMDSYPDVLIVDYLALMGTKFRKNGKFEEHEEIAHGLRDLGEEFGMYVFSAGQINREGQDVINVTPSHCQGGISVIQASDAALAITATEEDLDNNQLQVGQLKMRNNKKSSRRLTMYTNPKNLRMSLSPTSVDMSHVKSPISSYAAPKTDKKEAIQTPTTPNKPKNPKDKLKNALKLANKI